VRAKEKEKEFKVIDGDCSPWVTECGMRSGGRQPM
jgi:hypothetical protein